MTPHEATAWVTQHLAPAIRAEPLQGGLLNHVHRVWLADGGSVVVKRAPPHVASRSELPLDPARADMEAAALSWLAPRGAPVPKLIDHRDFTLILEDLGDLPDLEDWLADGGDPGILHPIAAWLRRLHEQPGPGLHNAGVQRTRLELQYGRVGDWLEDAGMPDARALGALARATGEGLLEPGDVFVMGDLWPPSIRVGSDARIRVLDWELATTGRRGQDLGHLAAHLDLAALARRIPKGLSMTFLTAYGPLSAEDARITAVHHAAELLARSVGAFPRPDLDDTARRDAVLHAVVLLRAAAAAAGAAPGAPPTAGPRGR